MDREMSSTRLLSGGEEPATREIGSASAPIETLAPQLEQIGPYRVLEVIGRGGMGVVFLAEQEEPVKRRLAIKLIHRNLHDPVALARFEAERQAMARLSHTNIAQIHDAGTTEDGFPYFAMEHVEGGEPLNTYCDDRGLGINERLRLFIAVCRGVHHAHQRGIIHRDLKPNNLLVREEQGEPVVKVIDFGLAKALDQPLAGEERLTVGYLIGTPEYISPEAFGDTAGDLDIRSDVYSLGVILSELLCGSHPFDTEGKNFLALAQEILTEEPQAPSRRLLARPLLSQAEIAAARRATPTKLQQRLSGDLDFVVLQAVARERDERYESVAQLATDIERHLRKEPVEAHPASPGYRIRKFVRRHRSAVSSGVLMIIVLVLGTVGTTLGMIRANHEADLAQQAQGEAEELARFLEDLFSSNEPGNPARDMTARQLLKTGADGIAESFEHRPRVKARILGVIGKIYLRLALYEEAESLLLESASLKKETFGIDHPAFARVQMQLARLRHEQDRLDESRRLTTGALAVFEAQDLPQDTAEALQFLAYVEHVQGNFQAAENLLRRSLEAWSRNVGDDHEGSLETMTRLARLLDTLDRLDEAEELIQTSINLHRERYGADHANLILPLRTLAGIQASRGLEIQAIASLEQALTIAEGTYDEEHPQIGQMLVELADNLSESGDYEQAEVYYQRGSLMLERVHGGDSLDLAMALNNFGTLYWAWERYDEAETAYRRALRIQEKFLEPGNPRIAHPIVNLGLIDWKRGRFDSAEALLLEGLASWEESLGPDHQALAWPFWGLAGVYRDQQRFDKAEPLYLRALKIREALLPPDDKDLLDLRRDYAQLLRATGRDSEADRFD